MGKRRSATIFGEQRMVWDVAPSGSARRRSRAPPIQWTTELEYGFLSALWRLRRQGIKVTPALIHQEMGEPSLSKEQVTSHFQRYKRKPYNRVPLVIDREFVRTLHIALDALESGMKAEDASSYAINVASYTNPDHFTEIQQYQSPEINHSPAFSPQ